MRFWRTGSTDENPTPHARKNPLVCSLDGCTRKSVALGLCDTHYRAMRQSHVVKAARLCRWCADPIATDAGTRAMDCPRCRVLTNKLKPYKDFSVGDYLALYEKQDGRCACCGVEVLVLDVDHEHDSDRVRGLLCGRCNTAIGFLGDTLEGVLRAVAYLRG